MPLASAGPKGKTAQDRGVSQNTWVKRLDQRNQAFFFFKEATLDKIHPSLSSWHSSKPFLSWYLMFSTNSKWLSDNPRTVSFLSPPSLALCGREILFYYTMTFSRKMLKHPQARDHSHPLLQGPIFAFGGASRRWKQTHFYRNTHTLNQRQYFPKGIL